MRTNAPSPLAMWLDSQPRGAAKELAEALGVSDSFISDVKRNRRTLSPEQVRIVVQITRLKVSQLPRRRVEVRMPGDAR